MNLETLPRCDVSARTSRASVAQMTLQLRALLRDATAEEERSAIVDVDAAREKLRARLGPLVDERRRSLDESLAAARAEAAVAIAAARAAASSTIEAPSVEVTEPVVRVTVVEASIAAPVADPIVYAPYLPVRQLSLSSLAEAPDQTPTFNIVIDPEAFAQAFAASFAELFEAHVGSIANALPTWFAQPAPAEKTTTKASFWTHARHPDVLLIGLSMVIVLVVLAAWFV